MKNAFFMGDIMDQRVVRILAMKISLILTLLAQVVLDITRGCYCTGVASEAIGLNNGVVLCAA